MGVVDRQRVAVTGRQGDGLGIGGVAIVVLFVRIPPDALVGGHISLEHRQRVAPLPRVHADRIERGVGEVVERDDGRFRRRLLGPECRAVTGVRLRAERPGIASDEVRGVRRAKPE